MVYKKGHKPKNALNLQFETDRYYKTMSKPIAEAWHKPEFVRTVETLSVDEGLLTITKKLITDPEARFKVESLLYRLSLELPIIPN